MDLVNRELRNHLLFVLDAETYIFSNPKHLKGIESYDDKKMIDKLKNRIANGKVLTTNHLQFLETIYKNY